MVTLVVTSGFASMSIYSQKLAENLDVPKVYSDIYPRVAGLFNIPLLSQEAIRAAREDLRFVKMLNEIDDIIHLPNHHLGRYGPFLRKPYIITVHDLIRYFDLKGYGTFIHRPNIRDRVYLSLDYAGVKRAAKIIAVSESTRRDLVRHLGVSKQHVTVIHEGVDRALFRPTGRRPIDHPYLLFVGTEHPRKNFIGLMRAFRRLKASGKFRELKLVKVGRAGGREANFRGRTLEAVRRLGLGKEVIFAGHVPTEELPAYYSGAECFVLPSFYEGFGLTALEAMACGCPVIASNSSSLPEVTGDAAIHVDPHDIDALASAIRRVLADDSLKEDLTRKGLKRAREFSWEATARKTLEAYQQVESEIS